MKTYLTNLLIILTNLLIFYSAFSFVYWNPNPNIWGQDARYCYVIFTAGSTFLTFLYINHMKSENNEK